MDFKDLSAELQDKVKSCESAEELMALASTEGVELSDAELEGVSGGWSCAEYEPMDLP